MRKQCPQHERIQCCASHRVSALASKQCCTLTMQPRRECALNDPAPNCACPSGSRAKLPRFNPPTVCCLNFRPARSRNDRHRSDGESDLAGLLRFDHFIEDCHLTCFAQRRSGLASPSARRCFGSRPAPSISTRYLQPWDGRVPYGSRHSCSYWSASITLRHCAGES